MSSIRRILQNDWIIDLIFFAIMLLLFYTAWLGSYPVFTPDEGRYTEVAREMVARGDYITPRVNGVVFLDKPILYYWLQALSIQLFGLKEWAYRLFPVLLGLIGCLTTYICTRHLFDRLTAWFAAALLATTPLYFACSHYANLDLEVAVLISASLLCFITGVGQEGRRRLWFFCAAYAFSGLAILTKGMIGLAFPVMIVGLWVSLSNQWSVLKRIYIFRGLLIISAIILPWFLLIQRANPEFFYYFFVTQHVTRYLSGAAFNNQSPAWFYVPIVLLGFFPWSLFLFQSFVVNFRNVIKNTKSYSTELYLFLWVICVFTFFSIPHSKIISYILPIFPPLAILIARYFAILYRGDTIKQQHVGWQLIAGGLLFAIVLLVTTFVPILPLPATFTPHIKLIAYLFILSALIGLIFLRRKSLLFHFSLWNITTIAYLLVVIAGATHLNVNTAKPLTTYLQTVLKPEDEVVHYFKYYYDVPLYLHQQVTLVNNWDPLKIRAKDNWARELLDGRHKQEANWLINEEIFWSKWHSKKRLYVFLNTNYLNQFKVGAPTYFVVQKHRDILLVSNQPQVT
ncbi:MAG: glycosyltransferase family 39 protein [Gammaproteobacteria bacterium]|nr:glycosyltransferase family 39 protein [Gammaproteobacteria bacterium]